MTCRLVLSFVLATVAAMASTTAPAQIVIDDTLGRLRFLFGDSVRVDETLGQARGDNLFYSFQTFSVAPGQEVVFSADRPYRNVISRVTGGEPSLINGRVVSVIGAQGFFFINPAGVVIGPGGGFLVDGDLHISAADRLVFEDGSVFSATEPGASTLTVAAPESFGFLDAGAGRIEIRDNLLNVNVPRVALTGKDVILDADTTINLLDSGTITIATGAPGRPVPLAPAGDVARPGSVRIDGASDLAAEAGQDDPAGVIAIESGTVFLGDGSTLSVSNINDTASAGRIAIAAETLTLETATLSANGVDLDAILGGAPDGSGAVGSIALAASTVAIGGGSVVSTAAFGNATGGGGLDVSARERLTISGDAFLNATALQRGTGGGIALDAPRIEIGERAILGSVASVLDPGATARGGDITLTGEVLRIDGDARLTTETATDGAAGTVSLSGDRIEIAGAATLSTEALAGTRGAAGSIRLDAPRIAITDAAGLTSETAGLGSAGTIRLDGETVLIEGTASLAVSTVSLGDGGTIEIDATTFRLADSARLEGRTVSDGRGGKIEVRALHSATFTDEASVTTSTTGAGAGGSIDVRADSVALSGTTAFTSENDLQFSGGGDAGDITLSGRSLALSDAARVSSSVLFFGVGDGGTISLVFDESVTMTGTAAVLSETDNEGRGGDIRVVTPRLALHGGPQGAPSISASSISDFPGFAADAGDVTLELGEMVLSDGAAVTTASVLEGGGRIVIEADGLVRLDGGRLVTEVAVGGGDGGDVRIDGAFLVIDEASTLIADAVDGDGGDLLLSGTGIFIEEGAVLSASSEFGTDGRIEIEGVEENLVGVEALDPGFFDPRALLGDPCLAAASGRSGLSLAGGGARLDGPGAPSLFLDAVPFPEDAATGAADGAPPRLALGEDPCGGTVLR